MCLNPDEPVKGNSNFPLNLTKWRFGAHQKEPRRHCVCTYLKKFPASAARRSTSNIISASTNEAFEEMKKNPRAPNSPIKIPLRGNRTLMF
jgi:hypothetical protein